MERLTGYDYIAGVKTGDLLLGVNPQKTFDRLAAYEDTGLEPEDIKGPFTEDVVLKLAGAILGVAPDRLRELAQADREGRVYIEEKAYQCPKCGSHRLTPRVDGKFYFCFNCKEQFPKEAEASLRRVEV